MKRIFTREEQTLVSLVKDNYYASEKIIIRMCRLAKIEINMFICSQVQEEFFKYYGLSLTCSSGTESWIVN